MEKIGSINVYKCSAVFPHSHGIVYLNNGTTPFMIRCLHENCLADAQSSFLNVKLQGHVILQWAWYIPQPAEFGELDDQTQGWILTGHLIKGKLAEVSPLRPDPRVEDGKYGEFLETMLRTYDKLVKPEARKEAEAMAKRV
jgi:hypothetical protein